MIGLIKNLQNSQIENFTDKICKEILFGTLSAQKEIEKTFGKFDKKSFSSPLSKAVSIRKGWKLISKDTFEFISGENIKIETEESLSDVIKNVCFIEMADFMNNADNPEEIRNKIPQTIVDILENENRWKDLMREFSSLYFKNGYSTNEDYSYRGKVDSLTIDEIASKGKAVGLKTISDSVKFISDSTQVGHDTGFGYSSNARSLAKIKDQVNLDDLSQKEKNLIVEISWLGVVGIADTAKELFTVFNPSDSARIFIENVMGVLKEKWPNESATKEYYSDTIKGITSQRDESKLGSPLIVSMGDDEGIRILRERVIESFVDTYKDYSILEKKSLEVVAKDFVDQIIALGMGRARGILFSDKE